ncbi:hypothetical protein D1839_19495 [Roseburia sp. 1XD42-34]|nr:hypothetical protein [Roseburia sp. 1XD42-34]RKI74107.1 hypothetical protein D7V87_19480 [Clostridium sp. 1xD42-85]
MNNSSTNGGAILFPFFQLFFL